MNIFENYFNKYDSKKWKLVMDAKPTVEPGMTKEMHCLYDKIVQVSKKKKSVYIHK
jgi:hypothetical protein